METKLLGASEFKRGDPTTRSFTGLGAAFHNVDRQGDIIVPGAFRQTIARHTRENTMPALLWQHDHTEPIGRWVSMRETTDGLEMAGELADTRRGREAYNLMKFAPGSLSLSIGFTITDTDFDRDGNRLLKAVDLWEVSTVALPANPEARIHGVKKLERLARQSGYSKRASVRIASPSREPSHLELERLLAETAARFRELSA